MLTEHLIHTAPSHQEQDPSERIARKLQSGDRDEIRRGRWMLAELWRVQSHAEFSELLRDVLDTLLAMADPAHPERVRPQQQKKLERQVFRVTGLRLLHFASQDEDAGYIPSQEEIRAACAEIRAGWTKDQRRARWAKPAGWSVPKVRVSRRAS